MAQIISNVISADYFTSIQRKKKLTKSFLLRLVQKGYNYYFNKKKQKKPSIQAHNELDAKQSLEIFKLQRALWYGEKRYDPQVHLQQKEQKKKYWEEILKRFNWGQDALFPKYSDDIIGPLKTQINKNREQYTKQSSWIGGALFSLKTAYDCYKKIQLGDSGVKFPHDMQQTLGKALWSSSTAIQGGFYVLISFYCNSSKYQSRQISLREFIMSNMWSYGEAVGYTLGVVTVAALGSEIGSILGHWGASILGAVGGLFGSIIGTKFITAFRNPDTRQIAKRELKKKTEAGRYIYEGCLQILELNENASMVEIQTKTRMRIKDNLPNPRSDKDEIQRSCLRCLEYMQADEIILTHRRFEAGQI